MLNEQQVVRKLCAAVDAAGGVRAFGRKHRISPAYVSKASRGEMKIGEKVEKALGLRRVTRWVAR